LNMNRLIHFLMTLFLGLALSLSMLAQAIAQTATEPQSVDEAITLLATIVKLFQEGQYLLGGAALTLVLVFVFRKFVLFKLATRSLPLVSAVTGLLAGTSIALLAGATPMQALLATLSGPLASTLWDGAIKFVVPQAALPKKPGEPHEQKAA
jgi:hypothetical protein